MAEVPKSNEDINLALNQSHSIPVVVILEDVEEVKNSIKKMLSTLSVKVISCSSGKKFMELIKKDEVKINLLLLDLMIPDMNGIEVLEAIKEVRAQKPFRVCVLIENERGWWLCLSVGMCVCVCG